MRLKQMCADEMPREKLMTKGPESLSNAELLAILLRTGRDGANVIDVAREMLIAAGGRLTGLALMSTENLCRIPGIGSGKAVSVAAAFELGRRLSLEISSAPKVSISAPVTVFRLMYPILRDLCHEECWLLYLNKSNRLIGKEMITRGGIDSTVVDNRVVIRKMLDRHATGLVLVHNHPSGNAMPSTADISQTRSLNNALKTCDLFLLDHVVIASDSYYSFADERLVETVSAQTDGNL